MHLIRNRDYLTVLVFPASCIVFKDIKPVIILVRNTKKAAKVKGPMYLLYYSMKASYNN